VNVKTRKEGPWTVIEVDGEIDAHTAPGLKEVIGGSIDQGERKIVVDLEGVSFMDSTGLGVLVSALKRIEDHDGKLRVACASRPILRVMQITGLDKMMPLFAAASEATAA
jgi:anti-sigma B factor antagonist